jgi:glycerol-3-phosphate acyltransferase PlsY
MKIVFTGRERRRARGALLESAAILPAARSGTAPLVLATLAVVLAAYLLGSVSFAVVVSRAFGLPDPHEYGSGNPGATNVLRTGNRKAALLTLVGDGLKGFVAVVAARYAARAFGLDEWTVPLAAVAVFVGHVYPVFHGFRGGKGVATGAGIVFALHWPLGLALTVVWLTMAFGFKVSSIAGLTAAVLMPLGMFYVTGPSPVAFAMLPIAALIFWRHKENIRKLARGRESTIGR